MSHQWMINHKIEQKSGQIGDQKRIFSNLRGYTHKRNCRGTMCQLDQFPPACLYKRAIWLLFILWKHRAPISDPIKEPLQKWVSLLWKNLNWNAIGQALYLIFLFKLYFRRNNWSQIELTSAVQKVVQRFDNVKVFWRLLRPCGLGPSLCSC